MKKNNIAFQIGVDIFLKEKNQQESNNNIVGFHEPTNYIDNVVENIIDKKEYNQEDKINTKKKISIEFVISIRYKWTYAK